MAALPLLAGLMFGFPDASTAREGAATLSQVVDLEGRPLEGIPAGAGPTVLVFTATECPLSNRYAPELQRLRARFAARGVRFHLVYADPAESVEAIRRHLAAFGLGADAWRDPAHELVRLTGATVTPEVAVFAPEAHGPRLVYRGRIDDRAADLGRTRPQPRVHDLEQVLAALAAGQPVATRTTAAVGCFIPARR